MYHTPRRGGVPRGRIPFARRRRRPCDDFSTRCATPTRGRGSEPEALVLAGGRPPSRSSVCTRNRRAVRVHRHAGAAGDPDEHGSPSGRARAVAVGLIGPDGEDADLTGARSRHRGSTGEEAAGESEASAAVERVADRGRARRRVAARGVQGDVRVRGRRAQKRTFRGFVPSVLRGSVRR